MRASMAYFAGAGTVVVAIAVGLGGGFVIADVLNPQARKELSKAELQAKAQRSPQPGVAQPSPSPVTASNAPQPPAPYATQVQPAASAPVVVGAAPHSSPQPQNPPQPKNEVANAAPPPAATSSDPSAKRDDAPKVKQADQAPSQPATRDGASVPENAYAKARDADLKRPDDKRKSDRRQWATRHQQQHNPDMRDVEQQVRRDAGPHEVFVERDDSDRPDYGRRDYDRPMRFGFPHMNFFGPDD